MYKALADAIRDAEREKKSLAEVALATEARDQGRPVEEIRAALRRALDVMRSIKQVLDPQGILNPGKIFPETVPAFEVRV